MKHYTKDGDRSSSSHDGPWFPCGPATSSIGHLSQCDQSHLDLLEIFRGNRHAPSHRQVASPLCCQLMILRFDPSLIDTWADEQRYPVQGYLGSWSLTAHTDPAELAGYLF